MISSELSFCAARAPCRIDPDEYKTVADPQEEDALVWARWGGASFDMNMARHFCLQNFDKTKEPARSASTIDEAIKLEDFLKMIECNWPKGSDDEDVVAYLNRSHFVLLTDKWIYFRFAFTPLTDLVSRMEWPTPNKPDLFIPETVAVNKAYKKDQTKIPEDYAADLEWGIALLNALAQGHDIPRTITILRTCQHTDRETSEYRHPQLSEFMLPEPGVGPHNEIMDGAESQHDEVEVDTMPFAEMEDVFGFAGAGFDDDGGNGGVHVALDSGAIGAAEEHVERAIAAGESMSSRPVADVTAAIHALASDSPLPTPATQQDTSSQPLKRFKLKLPSGSLMDFD